MSLVLGLENSIEIWNMVESDPRFKDQLESYQISIVFRYPSSCLSLDHRAQLLGCLILNRDSLVLRGFPFNHIWAYFVKLPARQSIWLPDKFDRHILPTFWISDSVIEPIILKTPWRTKFPTILLFYLFLTDK